MLGIRTIFFITIFVLIPLTIPAFGNNEILNNSIYVETDKAEYSLGELAIITGIVEEKKMPVAALKIFDTEGNILSANQLEIGDDNTFTKSVLLEEPFYEKTGTYTITVDYGKLHIETNFEVENEEDQAIVLQNDLEEFEPEVIVVTDKSVYQDGDTIEISGMGFFSKESTVLVGIYDPFGNPAGFYLAELDPADSFSISFLAKAGVNFKTEGTYSVIARYDSSEDEITFDFVNSVQPTEDVNTVEKISEEQLVDNISSNSNKENTEEPEEKDDQSSENTSNPTNNNYEKESVTPDTILNENIDKNTNEEKTTSNVVQIENEAQQKVSASEKNNKENKITKPGAPTENLSVDDIELGILLNRINLNCDKTQLVDVISYYDGMGPALVRLCKYNDAISYYDQSLIDDPNNNEILNNKGSALNKLGLYDEAITYYNSALDIEPDFVPALNNKANALAAQGNYYDAVSVYNQALLLAPDNAIIISNLEKVKEKLASNNEVSIKRHEMPVSETELQNVVTKTNTRQSDFLEQLSNTIASLGNALLGFLS